MLCPYNGFQDCHGKDCAVYNPFLNGCAFLVNPLALGEELASCRHEIRQISAQLDTLISTLQEGQSHVSDILIDLIASIQDNAVDYIETARTVIAEAQEVPVCQE